MRPLPPTANCGWPIFTSKLLAYGLLAGAEVVVVDVEVVEVRRLVAVLLVLAGAAIVTASRRAARVRYTVR